MPMKIGMMILTLVLLTNSQEVFLEPVITSILRRIFQSPLLTKVQMAGWEQTSRCLLVKRMSSFVPYTNG